MTLKLVEPQGEPLEDYLFAVWATQGGGLAKHDVGIHYVFVEAPGHSGLQVGDRVPEDWDIQPANDLARESFYGPCGH